MATMLLSPGDKDEVNERTALLNHDNLPDHALFDSAS
ncbi:BQ5605_C024g09772 [Microbotryum silenes-dioicae]|uniref:BQ5605_C024g09772 protein n=1 Tax=Microbotryum silenes-dioicae TaxID=796604 RepID=A0A2X0MPR3_9BASI|nr:BQ5605_C024g09772 [Microbotryum silenes-dioicae]